MQEFWKIETHGNPIGAVQSFIQRVWDRVGLDGMLASTNGGNRPRLLIHPQQLAEVNPFRPLMVENIARQVPAVLRNNPEKRYGALLRPCEMRALVEISKRESLQLDRILTICVDCLGTYPLEEYEWRVGKKVSTEYLTDEALKFARQGGILAYRYRPACQICVSPGAESANLNIHILGLPVRQQIFIRQDGKEYFGKIPLEELTDGLADQDLIQQNENTLARQTERHHQTMERVMHALEDLLPKNIDDLIAQFDDCGDCRLCMTVCPICSVEFPQRDMDGHFSRTAIKRWLVSCSGCGMCEQACRSNLPLGVIFGSIRERLGEEFGYVPGRSWDLTLPL